MHKCTGNVSRYKSATTFFPTKSSKNASTTSSSKRLFVMNESSIIHASKGEYTEVSNRHRKGGHGQDALDYMDIHGIKYEINIEYNNGVRRGNILDSKDRMRRSGNMQSWFPKNWTSDDIKNAAIEVSKTFEGKPKNGDKHTGVVNGVSITIVYGDDGKIRTAYPSKDQPGGIKNDK